LLLGSSYVANHIVSQLQEAGIVAVLAALLVALSMASSAPRVHHISTTHCIYTLMDEVYTVYTLTFTSRGVEAYEGLGLLQFSRAMHKPRH
jgi:hypothetical protein